MITLEEDNPGIDNYIIINGGEVYRLERVTDTRQIMEIPTHERKKHNKESVLSVCINGELKTYSLLIHGTERREGGCLIHDIGMPYSGLKCTCDRVSGIPADCKRVTVKVEFSPSEERTVDCPALKDIIT